METKENGIRIHTHTHTHCTKFTCIHFTLTQMKITFNLIFAQCGCLLFVFVSKSFALYLPFQFSFSASGMVYFLTIFLWLTIYFRFFYIIVDLKSLIYFRLIKLSIILMLENYFLAKSFCLPLLFSNCKKSNLFSFFLFEKKK